MAQTPLLTLADIRLTFGGKPLFEGVDLNISRGERAALVGRNGAGKSTLMKIVAGRIEPDSGEVWIQPGTNIVFAEQEPDRKIALKKHSEKCFYCAFQVGKAYIFLNQQPFHLVKHGRMSLI